jgi:multidrug/hemolysin transport system ATP-binding protein
MQNIIEVKNLKKTYNAKTAVDGISFAVPQRSLFAFLGQNGAGKTTTINMIIGLINRNDGEILYDGSPDFMSFKDKIGVVFQNNISDDLLTVEENLRTYGALYIRPPQKLEERLAEVTALLSLSDFIKQRFKTLSGGQKRKVEIARALFMSPKILFLDEPTTGLDPKTRADIWRIIHKLKNNNGMTIFLTTHYMEETAASDQVAIIDKGKIIASGSPAELKSEYAFDRLLITPYDAAALEKHLDECAVSWDKTADTYMVKVIDTAQSIDFLCRLKDNIRFYEAINGSMDDVFLSVVGEIPTESMVAK